MTFTNFVSKFGRDLTFPHAIAVTTPAAWRYSLRSAMRDLIGETEGVNDRQMTAKSGPIYIGIGGWTFEPWRGLFYPDGLPHSKELAYAAARLTSIEVNGTFYRTQTPATFRKWASEVPADFKFALKGPRFATNRRVLKEAGDSIKRFLDSGVTELG